MKKNILTSIGLTALFAVGIVSLNVVSDSGTTSAYASASGSDGGRTNSPGDASNCTSCHSGTINSGSGTRTITSSIPVGGYVPGQSYTITGSVSEASINKFGFEMTAEKDADNSKIGTIIITDATNTKAIGTSAVTHESAGTAGSGTKSWSFDWIAPAIGTGDVTFYGAFNAANSNNMNGGDQIYTKSLTVSEAIPTGLGEYIELVSATIFPNPVKTAFQISTTEVIDNVVVYNLAGKKMSNVNQTVNKFDVSSLASGIYFVHIESKGNVMTKKMIKE